MVKVISSGRIQVLRSSLVAAAAALLLIAVGGSGCSSMKVDSTYVQDLDFGQYRTFDWIPALKGENPSVPGVGIANIKLIKTLTERELYAKGIGRNTEDPDFLIAFHGRSEDKVETTTFDSNVGPGARISDSEEVEFEYKEGVLIYDFVDAETGIQFWRGWASDAIEDPGEVDEKIKEAVTKIFAGYPPTPK